MACALLELSLPATLATILGLMCDLERLQLLVQFDAAPDQRFATDCISIETLDAHGDECKEVFEWPHGTFNKLYNDTKAERFLEMLSLQNMPCECTAFSAAADCNRCNKLAMLKELGSPGRAAMLQLHKRRAAEAQAIRARHAMLQRAAQVVKDHACNAHASDCAIAESLAANAAPRHSPAQNSEKVYTYTF
jgi:hypothetical protein